MLDVPIHLSGRLFDVEGGTTCTGQWREILEVREQELLILAKTTVGSYTNRVAGPLKHRMGAEGVVQI